mgnify:CR=1 FL=1
MIMKCYRNGNYCDPERMTDERCNKKGWNHAYVMMLDSLKEWELGTDGFNRSGY